MPKKEPGEYLEQVESAVCSLETSISQAEEHDKLTRREIRSLNYYGQRLRGLMDKLKKKYTPAE